MAVWCKRLVAVTCSSPTAPSPRVAARRPASSPSILDNATLAYTGSGASSIAVRGNTALSGNLSGGQVLIIESTCAENANVTAGASFTNAGTMVLTNGDACA